MTDLPSGDITLTWTTIGVAFVAGVAAVVTASLGGFKQIVATWFELAELRLRKRYANGVKQIALMYRVIEDAKRRPYVHRILMLTGRNCGGIPQPPKPFTVSAFFGWSQKPEVDPASFYNFDIKADLAYMQMLQECIKDGASTQTTAKMPEQSMLKSYYPAEGVVDSRLYYLTIDPNTNELHYCSFANYEREFTAAEVHSLNLIADRLRSLLSYREG